MNKIRLKSLKNVLNIKLIILLIMSCGCTFFEKQQLIQDMTGTHKLVPNQIWLVYRLQKAVS